MTVHRRRTTATLDGDFVVFLIGMRINRPLHVHRWWPAFSAMSRMLAELKRQPKLGLLNAQAWFGRTLIVVQYWRSMDQLIAYAQSRDAAHLPAWHAFNQRARASDGAVGIWHETYAVQAGAYENIYIDMPPFGMARAGSVHEATGARRHAAGRLRRNGGGDDSDGDGDDSAADN